MKNLESARLKRYRVDPPIETATGFGAFFPGSEVYAFEFPKDDMKILKTTVSVVHLFGVESTRVSMVITIPKEQRVWTAGENEVYELQEYLQRPGESFVWQYDRRLHQMRVEGIKATKGIDFKWSESPVQVSQYNGEMPPLKQAYEAEMHEYGDYTYARGTIGGWQFVHLKVDSKLPWETLYNVTNKVFKNNLVQVFFNEETKKHPGEFVIWYNPSAMPII